MIRKFDINVKVSVPNEQRINEKTDFWHENRRRKRENDSLATKLNGFEPLQNETLDMGRSNVLANN